MRTAAIYRGRIAPSPTGYLHLGHGRTFWKAFQRARRQGGVLVLRNEDLDRQRCRAEFVSAMLEDLRWFGIEWQEGTPEVDKLIAFLNKEMLKGGPKQIRLDSGIGLKPISPTATTLELAATSRRSSASPSASACGASGGGIPTAA